MSDKIYSNLQNDDGHIDAAYLHAVQHALENDDKGTLLKLTENVHDVDIADLLSALSEEERSHFVVLLGEQFDFAALTELSDHVRSSLLSAIPNEVIASGVSDLDSDDAVYILEDLKVSDQEDILENIPARDRLTLQKSLDYPEDSAGRRMQSNYIAVPPFWDVGRTIDFLRESDDLPNEFYEIFVIHPDYSLLGSVALDKILRTPRAIKISDIMQDAQHQILATDDQEDAARTFQRYDLLSAAVIDDTSRLVGVLTIDDIVDVIQEEADEDMRALAGVGAEEVSDRITTLTRSRLPWLFINLLTAILASFVIGQFEDIIQEVVALAILLPIVASMGGNAATQTMTVAVRAIATKELGFHNMFRVIGRETSLGLINGLFFAFIMAAVTQIWFHNFMLSCVIGAAMIINMVVAGMSGIILPLVLKRLDFDPALASGVFVTTLTDVIGFFAFLGLAALYLL